MEVKLSWERVEMSEGPSEICLYIKVYSQLRVLIYRSTQRASEVLICRLTDDLER